MSYKKDVNNIVPEAEAIADEKVKMEDYTEREDWAAEWNRVYFDAMDRLCAEAGVRYSRVYPKKAA